GGPAHPQRRSLGQGFANPNRRLGRKLLQQCLRELGRLHVRGGLAHKTAVCIRALEPVESFAWLRRAWSVPVLLSAAVLPLASERVFEREPLRIRSKMAWAICSAACGLCQVASACCKARRDSWLHINSTRSSTNSCGRALRCSSKRAAPVSTNARAL